MGIDTPEHGAYDMGIIGNCVSLLSLLTVQQHKYQTQQTLDIPQEQGIATRHELAG